MVTRPVTLPPRLWRALALALAAAAPLSVAAAPDLAQLRIASEGARPPYNFFNASNELAGFEIDLGRELCRRMKATCTFVPAEWDSMSERLNGRHFDAIMAAMEITPERERVMAFTKPYMRMPSAFLKRREDVVPAVSPAALEGRNIGVEAGGPHEAFIAERYSKSTLRAYTLLEEAILDLAQGRIDVVIGDKDAVVDFLKTRREAQCCVLAGDVPRDPAFFGEGVGIGLRKSDDMLKRRFETALDGAVADGSYDRLRAKYFDFDIR